MLNSVRRALAIAGGASALLLAGQVEGAAQDFEWQGVVDRGDAVTVRGVNGRIIAREARGGRVTVEATKTARRDDPSSVDIQVIEDAGGVLICAVYPSRRNRDPNRCARGRDYEMNVNDNDVRVDFVVEVPSGVELEAMTVNGDVEARGLTADVKAVTVNGGIEVESEGVVSATTVNGSIEARMGTAPSERLKFHTVNGGIRLVLPRGTNADVDIETVNGHIDTDFPLTIRGRWGPRSASGEIGSGGPEIELQTVNGSIELVRG
ncbi:MAG: DUF4097 family beta strand repeat-containing protein [Gemmatimonadetes bacterium]|nr:DUF4097 family beta strand repeat-containing protein [Gemmatimonadota bacterium]